MKEALRQAFELQTVLLAARPHKTSARTFWGNRSPPPGGETRDDRHGGALESRATSGVAAPMESR